MLALSACGGGGRYNYAQSYAPLRAEKGYFRSAEAVPYEDVKRDPNGFKSVNIGWFGVVTAVDVLSDGRARISLSLRAHQERHLCSDQNASSCRLTVATRDLGPFTVDLALSPEEQNGPERIWVGSLLKIYGHASGDYDEHGGPILDVTYYRHWPRGTYVTTAQRGGMRR